MGDLRNDPDVYLSEVYCYENCMDMLDSSLASLDGAFDINWRKCSKHYFGKIEKYSTKKIKYMI